MSPYSFLETPAHATTLSRSQIMTERSQVLCNVSAYCAAKAVNSPIGEMGIFAAQYADTLAKTCGMSIAVFDRDSVIACSGIPKKEYMERKPSEAIEKIMEKRAFFNGEGENTLVIREDGSRFVSCAMPIQSAGDIVGCVVSVKENGDNARDVSREAEHKLIQTAAGFLGRQLEE